MNGTMTSFRDWFEALRKRGEMWGVWVEPLTEFELLHFHLEE